MPINDPNLLERFANAVDALPPQARPAGISDADTARLREIASLQRADPVALARFVHAALQRTDISVAYLLNQAWGELTDDQQEVFRVAVRAILREL